MYTPTNKKHRGEASGTFKRRRTTKGGEDLKGKLTVAIWRNNLQSIQSELESWDRISGDSDLERFPSLITMAASLDNRSKILRYLIEKGAKVDEFYNGVTPLMVAVTGKIYENVRVLLNTKTHAQFKYQNKVEETLTKLNARVFPEGVACVIAEMICPIGANVDLRDRIESLTPLEMTYKWDFGGPNEHCIRDLLLSQVENVWPDYLQKSGQSAPFTTHWGDRQVLSEDEY